MENEADDAVQKSEFKKAPLIDRSSGCRILQIPHDGSIKLHIYVFASIVTKNRASGRRATS